MDLDLYYAIPEVPSPANIEGIEELQTFFKLEVANPSGFFNPEVPQSRTTPPAVAVQELQFQEDTLDNLVEILFRDVNTAAPTSPANEYIQELPADPPVNTAAPVSPAHDIAEVPPVPPVNYAVPVSPANDIAEVPVVPPGRYKCPCLNCVQRTGVKDG